MDNPLGSRPIRELVWEYSLPSILSQLINSVHNIVDQVFIGWGINKLAIAATNVIFPLSTVMTAVSALVGMGASAAFSIFLGKKQSEKAAEQLGCAVSMLCVSGIAIALVCLLFLEPMLYLFGATEPIMEYAVPYARIFCMGLPFGIFSAGMSYFIRSDGSPGFSSAVLLSGAIFNMVFDPVFLFAFDMGISGIALATALGQVLSAALAVFYLLRRLKTVSLSAGKLKMRGSIVVSVFSLGAATFSTHVLTTIWQIIQLNALRSCGAASVYGSETVIAASGAVSKLSVVFLASIVGIAIGCQPIWGFNLGQKNYARVKDTYILSILSCTVIATVSFLLMQLFPRTILSMFGSEDALFLEFGVRYIRICMAAFFLNALQPVTSMFCTATGQARLGLWMAVMRHGVLLISLLLLLPRLMGLDGVLLAGSLSDTCAAIIVIFIGRAQIKKFNRLEEEKTLSA